MLSLDELINHFLEELKMEGRTIKTYQTYKTLLQRFRQWCEENNIDFKTIKLREFRSFRNWLINEHEYQPISVNTTIYALKTFYNYLVEKEIVPGNPLIASRITLHIEEKAPRFLTDDELKTILLAIEKSATRLEFLTMLYSGLRSGEIIRLRPDDVVTVNNSVLLRVVRGKGKRGRYAPVVDEETAKELLELKNKRMGEATLFGSSQEKLRYEARKIAQLTGIEFTSHRLRHTFATRLLMSGETIDVVQDALGHKSIEATRRYAKTLPQAIFRLAARIG
jgi:site-specific recombinase XerD